MKKQLSINDLVPEEDVASGQHTPAGEVMWASPTVGLADDEEEFQKEALGLTDIPASLHGGEVLDFQGIPENPGLSRELGDDEETDYFGAEDVGVDDLPPENYRNDLEALAKLLNNESKLKLKSIIKSANNINLFVDRINNEVAMINDLNKLERLLRQEGRNTEANLILGLKKEAGVAGGVAGAVAGAALLSVFPPTMLIPIPVKMIIGGAAGSAIQNYLTSNPRAQEELKQQSQAATDLGLKLKQYGVYETELQQLADNKISAQQLVDNLRTTGRKTYGDQKLLQLAQQYIVANNRVTGSVQAAYKAVGGTESKEEIADPTTVPNVQERTGPIASPARTGRKGSITIPGDPYTYEKNPKGEGYVVVSGPSSIGAVLKPGTEAYEKVKAADPGAQAPTATDPKAKARELFLQGNTLAGQGKFEEAAAAYQQSYDLMPTPESLFNVGKSYHDGGNAQKALEVFSKYKNTYPEEWTKNESMVPEGIRNQLTDKPAISANEIPEQFKATRESISYVLSKFLRGVPVTMSISSGQGLTSDTKRARRLAEKYMKGMADTNQPEERVGIVATTLAEEFGARIESGMKARLDRVQPLPPNASETEKKKREDDLRGLFNGLIWQALREGWAKYKNAPLKKAPTERSEDRRLNKIDRQDERDVRKIERQERRASARKEARYSLIEQLHKVVSS